MTDTGYYDQSYPPSLWAPPVPPVVHSTGATAGVPGSWSPADSTPPANVADLIAGVPNPVVATPATLWTVGQYVQTGTTGVAGRAHWSGTAWETGIGPAAEVAPETVPPEEPAP